MKFAKIQLKNMMTAIGTGLLAMVMLSSCSKMSPKPHTENFVQAEKDTDQEIGDDQVRFRVIEKETLKENQLKPISQEVTRNTPTVESSPQTDVEPPSMVVSTGEDPILAAIYAQLAKEEEESKLSQGSPLKETVTPSTPAITTSSTDPVVSTPPSTTSEELQPASPSLSMGFPISHLDQPFVFGATVTNISEPSLGMLKLTNLPPIDVKPVVVKTGEEQYGLALTNCIETCPEEVSVDSTVIVLPILGSDAEDQYLMLNLESLGNQLSLFQLIDPQGSQFQIETVSSRAISFDYTDNTLVFDIESIMKQGEQSFTVTVRWYLKWMDSQQFSVRQTTPGVGFLQTMLSPQTKIQRFQVNGNQSIHYYVKGFPQQYHSAVVQSFEDWNQTFASLAGVRPFTYTFINVDHPQYQQIMAGDIRYNVMEWDLTHLAGYAGFGPQLAHQNTGRVLSGNILIQGPSIIQYSQQWHQMETQLRQLEGQQPTDSSVQEQLAQLEALKKETHQLEVKKFQVSIGNLKLDIPSQRPELHDSHDSSLHVDFFRFPKGLNLEEYLLSYIQSVVTHELGHNLGLRHNFKGNLSAHESEVSSSVMEYLPQTFSHRRRIGYYDQMAIAYGYYGIAPERTDLYCTDTDIANPYNNQGSAECSRNDATNDSYGYFKKQLQRITELLSGQNTLFVWNHQSMTTDILNSLVGMAAYGKNATSEGTLWTHFFRPDRPTDPALVASFVLNDIKAIICNPTLETYIEQFPDASKEVAMQNIQFLRYAVVETLAPINLYSREELACQ